MLDDKIFDSERVRRVMLDVDRGDFTDNHPYFDGAQSIGYGATISAPHMHAIALKEFENVIHPNSRILDVGSGSGYLTACFAKLAGPDARVVGIEHIEELVELSKRNIRKHNADLLDSGRVKLVAGDGRLGYPSDAPYDAIHVGAAAAKIPQALIDQLAIGGQMLIPVGSSNQEFLAIEKQADGSVSQRRIAHVIYVPLTEREAQLNRTR